MLLKRREDLSKTFGEPARASRAPILSIDEGEIIGLIGPNGAGKSTFFNCLAGDMLPTTGRIVFDSTDVTRAPPEEHARLGIGRTFQVPATFEDMTVLDNVMVGAFLRHQHRADARAQAQEVLELAGLTTAQRPARALARHARPQAARDRARARDRAAADAARRGARRPDPDRIAAGDRAGEEDSRDRHHHRDRRAHHGSDHDAGGSA